MADQVEPTAGQPGLPPFPTWPPPSGGAPVTKWETGPIAGNPPPGTTFPAGKALGVPGTIITPTGPVRTMGGPLS